MHLLLRRPTAPRSALLFTAAAVLVTATLASVVRDVSAAPTANTATGNAGQDAREVALKTLAVLLKSWNDNRSRLTNAAPLAAQANEEPSAESDSSEESDELDELSTEKHEEDDEPEEDADVDQDEGAELARQVSDPGTAVEARGVRDRSVWGSRVSSLRSGSSARHGRRRKRPQKSRHAGARSRTSFGGGNVLHFVDQALTHGDTLLGIVERLKNLFAPVQPEIVHLPAIVDNTNGGIVAPE